MSNVSKKLNANDQLEEQIRLSYVHILQTYLQIHKTYKHFREEIMDERLKKNFHLIDHNLYNKTGKLNWDNIRQLMPPNLERLIGKKYSMLNENEIKLCCLHLFNVSGEDITSILSYTKKSVHTITYLIKKKTGIHNIRGDLKILLLCD